MLTKYVSGEHSHRWQDVPGDLQAGQVVCQEAPPGVCVCVCVCVFVCLCVCVCVCVFMFEFVYIYMCLYLLLKCCWERGVSDDAEN